MKRLRFYGLVKIQEEIGDPTTYWLTIFNSRVSFKNEDGRIEYSPDFKTKVQIDKQFYQKLKDEFESKNSVGKRIIISSSLETEVVGN